MKGKAYANKKKKENRPLGDFYSTPKSLLWVMQDVVKKEFNTKHNMFEPCTGKGAIAEELTKQGFYVIENDLYPQKKDIYSEDYLTIDIDTIGMKFNTQIISNPPFSLWDDFVNKAKTHCKKFMFIGRLNYLGTKSRQSNGLWENLKTVYVFNRYVDYQTPFREDGLFHVGAMATGWFLWDMDYTGETNLKVIDVQEYAKLGAFKK